MSTSGALELLLAAFRADTDPAGWQHRAAAVDADKLVISAIVLGIAPLLHWQLSAWGVTLPSRAWAKLLSARSASATRQQATQTQLAEILAAGARSQLYPIVLKGAYLAVHVYPDAGLRPMNDIDILVSPAELPVIEDILVRLGYTGHYKDRAEGARIVKHTSTFRKAGGAPGTPNPYLNAEAERTIEPHVSLEESWFGLRADITPGVRERSHPADFEGHTARALCPSDLMLHLCIHLSFHLIMGWPSIVQLLDLLWVGRRLESADWDALSRRAIDREVPGFIYAALRLARLELDAPVPAEVLAHLSEATAAGVRAHAESLSTADVMRRTQRPPLTTIRQRLTRSVRERAETARWAGTLPERLAVWRTLVDVAHSDTGKLIGARLRQAAGRNM
jgi:Uncharacterised nucleotidyltransferase